MTEDQERFIEDNVRIYDEPKVADRYSAVFMHEPQFGTKNFTVLGMSAEPFHPQGVGQMTTGYPGDHLGKRIKFTDLPEDCQKLLVDRLF